MLARKMQLSPRVPPIHERLALQSAKNISKLAAALPKPLTRTGHLPVLVELHNIDENVVYRYQVNLPSNSADQQMNMDEAKALSQQLNLPCLVHDRSSISQDIVPLKIEADAPQLVLMQSAMHKVHEFRTDSYAIPRESILTFPNCAYAIEAPKMTHDHFMSTLYAQQPSPMEYTVLWADKHYEEQEHSINMSYQAIPSQYAAGNNVKQLLPPLNLQHYNLVQQQQNQQMIVNPNQTQQKVLNGYKKPRKPIKLNNRIPNNNDFHIRRAGNNIDLPSSPVPVTEPMNINVGYNVPNVSNGFNLPYDQNRPNGYNQPDQILYFDPQEYDRQQVEHREYFNVLKNNQPHPMRPIYEHQPSGNLFEYQSPEQEFEYRKHVEDQNYKRMLTDSMQASQFPPELRSLFHWDCCHLCQTAMKTMRNALDHYLSRTHQRRVDSWLIRYSFVKGNLSEDILRSLRSSGSAVLHCDLCDLKLTSWIHARQHFYGRRHRLVERHISKPNGEGYYDKTGRWVRTNDKWMTCNLCDVIVTSATQLGIHMAGLRHRKRVRSTYPPAPSETYDGNHVYRIISNGTLIPLNPLGVYYNAGCAKLDERKFNNSKAAFYCEVCNITLNHLKSVKQHEEGRIHRKKLEKVKQAEFF